MGYDANNIDHVYRWCIIAHGFYRDCYLEREIRSGAPLAEVWNKETGEWKVVESVTPEYVLANADKTQKNIEDAYLTKDIAGLECMQKDFIEEFGYQFSMEDIYDINHRIERNLGSGAPKIRLLD